MKDLFVSTQGVRGGNTTTNKKGFVSIFLGNDKLLSVDNFHGSGLDYKQRENPIICIFDGEEVVFEGTKQQLLHRLNF